MKKRSPQFLPHQIHYYLLQPLREIGSQRLRSLILSAECDRRIVHPVRNSLSYVSYKDRKAVAADLKLVYSAATETQAEQAFN